MKVARHEKIIELIRQYEIDTQEELAARLNEAGFKVTQATVSRDIRALKMTKVAGSNGKSRYAILEEHTPDMLSDKYTIMCVVKTSEQAPGVVQKLGGILSRGK